MSGHLTQTVVAGGRIFPAGTAASDAEGVPAGPWWSDGGAPEPDPEPEPEAPEGEGDDTPQEPPRSGKGSGADAWRTYAETLGVTVPDDAGRDDIIAAVDQRQQD